jgi:DNA-binding beta-propeller fold protein YncE
MEFYRVKTRFIQLKRFNFTKRQIVISEAKSQVKKKLKNMESLGNVEYSESDCHVMYDANDITLSLDSEFMVSEGNSNVHSGNFLSNGNFAVTNYASNGNCIIYNKNWQPSTVIDGLNYPVEVIQSGEELFVTSKRLQSIEVFSAHDFQKLRSIKINNAAYGITKCNEMFYVACGNKIIKIDMNGKILKEYETEGHDYNVRAIKEGRFVYSNWHLHIVTAITDQGNTVWQYTHPRMKRPYGLDVDSVGNIFVAATQSNTIHVLSGAGELIRIIKDIPQPVFIKLMEERGMCCLCSNFHSMKVYKM